MASARSLSTKETRFSTFKKAKINNFCLVKKSSNTLDCPSGLSRGTPLKFSPNNAARVGSLLARCDLYLNSPALAWATPQPYLPISTICGLELSLQPTSRNSFHYNHDKSEMQVGLGVILSDHAYLICRCKIHWFAFNLDDLEQQPLSHAYTRCSCYQITLWWRAQSEEIARLTVDEPFQIHRGKATVCEAYWQHSQ